MAGLAGGGGRASMSATGCCTAGRSSHHGAEVIGGSGVAGGVALGEVADKTKIESGLGRMGRRELLYTSQGLQQSKKEPGSTMRARTEAWREGPWSRPSLRNFISLWEPGIYLLFPQAIVASRASRQLVETGEGEWSVSGRYSHIRTETTLMKNMAGGHLDYQNEKLIASASHGGSLVSTSKTPTALRTPPYPCQTGDGKFRPFCSPRLPTSLQGLADDHDLNDHSHAEEYAALHRPCRQAPKGWILRAGDAGPGAGMQGQRACVLKGQPFRGG
ncbi:hypothetical protein QBC41DRAFT_151229 [Cercophora samala]|uniref:Uncharacterized protein n=1 Tax=Cercophora samala TaxID=330535 RepID=A0AA40DAH9_9PEZI|nr:hypothetical protein QBC41DRAFT_151229 [Cercophora samala]